MLTLTIDSNEVYTQLGVAVSVTGIAQVLYIETENYKQSSMFAFILARASI